MYNFCLKVGFVHECLEYDKFYIVIVKFILKEQEDHLIIIKSIAAKTELNLQI